VEGGISAAKDDAVRSEFRRQSCTGPAGRPEKIWTVNGQALISAENFEAGLQQIPLSGTGSHALCYICSVPSLERLWANFASPLWNF
jgi:hypothetical protein